MLFLELHLSLLNNSLMKIGPAQTFELYETLGYIVMLYFCSSIKVKIIVFILSNAFSMFIVSIPLCVRAMACLSNMRHYLHVWVLSQLGYNRNNYVNLQ